jgi:hypothetical protein
MGALKSGVKSGNAEHKATGDDEGMVKALVELASFCDEQLRLKEDDGMCYIMDVLYMLSISTSLSLTHTQTHAHSLSLSLDIDSLLDTSVSV